MALRHLGGSAKRASPGEVLLVVHDFEARSPDELSLLKGEKIKLIERDDDFGDGWYLGKHVQDGRIGLFPEVYTKIAPHASNLSSAPVSSPRINLPGGIANSTQKIAAGTRGDHGQDSPTIPHNVALRASQTSLSTGNITEARASSAATLPLLNANPSPRVSSNASNPPLNEVLASPLIGPRSISIALGNGRGLSEDSPVMNETLSVIDEHITDMHTPRSSLMMAEHRGTNDSASEYSSHVENRLSYITGHETDEEESHIHLESEVTTWSPTQVAQGLKDIGVEPRHCEIFKEQEITGDVLLAMDQAAVFMKEFDLGLVGRRLRTWHKIKAFQEEVRKSSSTNNAIPNLLDGQSDDPEATKYGNQPSNLSQRSTSARSQDRLNTHFQSEKLGTHSLPSPHLLQNQRNEANATPVPLNFAPGSEGSQRPSAASIRELNHSRRHSAIDYPSFRPSTPTQNDGVSIPNKGALQPHKKTPSLDRNWTMGSFNYSPEARPFSALASSIPRSSDRNTFDPNQQIPDTAAQILRDIDRGYMSGGEIDARKPRKVLKKRDSSSMNHSKHSNHVEDLRLPTPTATKRQSRFGSVDSIRDTMTSLASPATKLYHGNSLKGRFRASSTNGINPIVRTDISSTESTPSAVTKLDYDKNYRPDAFTSSPRINGDGSWNSSPQSSSTTKSPLALSKSFAKPRIGLRAISDAVTGSEKASAASPISASASMKDGAVQSPTRTESSTPSRTSRSIDLDGVDASPKMSNSTTPTGLIPARATTRRKPKKETSAYIRGLEHKSPQEQMIGCDYSGWMKKKSSNLMKTWKPRLFVLRGRRLSYYYSETDVEERGLIDISFHRVLPADHDFITGIHAVVTGAKASPVVPSSAQSPTMASVDAFAHTESTIPKSDSLFIFKLVPPRAGLSRAVNFTKPTVHYFAVENITQGRLWMAALMKATIDRDETKPITTTFQQKTISLSRARALRHRPPALMGLDEKVDVEEGPKSDETGLHLLGVDSDAEDECGRKRAGSFDDSQRPSVARPGGEEVV